MYKRIVSVLLVSVMFIAGCRVKAIYERTTPDPLINSPAPFPSARSRYSLTNTPYLKYKLNKIATLAINRVSIATMLL